MALKIFYNRTRAVIVDEYHRNYRTMLLKSAQTVAASIESQKIYYENLETKIDSLVELGYTRGD